MARLWIPPSDERNKLCSYYYIIIIIIIIITIITIITIIIIIIIIIIITIINIDSGSIYKYNGSSPYKLEKYK